MVSSSTLLSSNSNSSSTERRTMLALFNTKIPVTSHMVHGYIFATFGDQAREFWQHVLGQDTAHIDFAPDADGTRRIMLEQSQCPAPPHALRVGERWLVDYEPDFAYGPLVPQTLYVPRGSENQVALKYKDLHAPVYFVQENGDVGVPLEGPANALLGAGDVVPGLTTQTTQFSLKWAGYREFEKPINVYDSRRDTGIKHGQLLGKVINFVKDFLNNLEAEHTADPLILNWRAQNTLEFRSRVKIVGLLQVTQGHYQPILQLRAVQAA